MLRQHSSHDIPLYSESTIENRSNSFRFSNMTNPSDVILNNDSSRKSGKDDIQTLGTANEELKNNNIALIDSVQEEENEI